jgi:TonB-dependent starch-binding outer membrane protein SusC
VTGAVGSVVAAPDGGPRVTRVEELLAGRVPGVEVLRLPGGELSVRIRGAAMGLNAGEPLFVVDGMSLPVGASAQRILAGISPGDVARIDVLKDAGSTAIFGARGVNGVIVITTRRPVR